MTRQQTCRQSGFQVGWIRGTMLLYDNSLGLEMQYQKAYELVSSLLTSAKSYEVNLLNPPPTFELSMARF